MDIQELCSPPSCGVVGVRYCVYIYICVCVYLDTNMYIYIYIYVYTYSIYMCIYIYIGSRYTAHVHMTIGST